MANKRRFTDEQERMICNDYKLMEKPSFAGVARKWNSSPTTIKTILNRHKVEIKDFYLDLEKEKDIITDYIENKLTMKEVGEKYGTSASNVCLILKKYGVSARNYHESGIVYWFNELVFDNPTNSEAAYWLGFLMGDGSIVKNRLSCELADIDKNHLFLLKEFLQSTHPVKFYDSRKAGWYGSCKIEVHSPHLVRTLSTYGIIQGKSTKNVWIKKGLMKIPDFWRGMIDSDGSIKIRKTKEGYELPYLSLCGTKKLMRQFIAFVRSHTSTKATPIKGKGNYYWRVTLEGKPARKIVKLLYGEGRVALERKNQVAQEIILRFPPELDECELQQKYLNLLKQGLGRSTAIKNIGKSYKTLNKWIQNSDFATKEWEIIENLEGNTRIITNHPLSTVSKEDRIEQYFKYRALGFGKSRSAKMSHFSYKTIQKLIRENEELAKREEEFAYLGKQ